MGTRSLTAFINKARESQEICVMYRQYDGYPEGHGLQLAEFLSSGKMVNGIAVGETELVFNGMGCLAAQVISYFKEEPGGFYIEPAGTRDVGEEYIYKVYTNDNGQLMMRCFDVWKGRTIFVGTPQKFITKYGKVKETV